MSEKPDIPEAQRQAGGSRKIVALGLVSLICFVAALYLVDFEEIAQTFSRVNPSVLVLAGLLVALNNLLAMMRFASVLKAMDFNPGKRALFVAFSLSQLSNQFLLNIFGQSLTRAVLLGRVGVPFGASLLATYLERALAAGLLLILSLFGVWYLLHSVTLDMTGSARELVTTLIGLSVVSCAVLLSLFRDRLSALYREHRSLWLRSFPPSALYTLLSHIAMLAAYLVVLTGFEAGGFTLGMAAALTVVMFTAALPISFSGWGIRELSAASALSLVGVSSSLAVVAAVAIGLLSLIVMMVFAGVAVLLMGRGPIERAAPPQPAKTASWRWDSVFIQVCAYFCAAFVFFQVRVPLRLNEIAVNIADIAAVTGASVIAIAISWRRMKSPLQPFARNVMIGFTMLIVYGLLVAYWHGSISQWALVNRGIGWLILLSYVAVGATVVSMAGERGRVLTMQSLIVAGLAVCALQFAFLVYDFFTDPMTRGLVSFVLKGFVQNQNAFVYQLAMVGVVLIVALRSGLFATRPMIFPAAFALIAFATYYSKSRTGLVFLLVLSVALLALSCLRAFADSEQRRRLRFAAAAVVFAVGFALVLPYLLYGLIEIFGLASSSIYKQLTAPFSLGIKIVHDVSEVERWQTIREALALWREHRVFGTGLGGYMHWRLESGAKPQVVHSVPVWLLAEMGLVGFTATVALAARLAYKGWRLVVGGTQAAWGIGLLGILLIMGVGGLVHDFFYQRLFWFLLGLFCAVVPRPIDDLPGHRAS